MRDRLKVAQPTISQLGLRQGLSRRKKVRFDPSWSAVIEVCIVKLAAGVPRDSRIRALFIPDQCGLIPRWGWAENCDVQRK
ncbi:MAG: hypothetical protein WDO12_15135 [Pseudomonadota bacterium]